MQKSTPKMQKTAHKIQKTAHKIQKKHPKITPYTPLWTTQYSQYQSYSTTRSAKMSLFKPKISVHTTTIHTI